MVTRPFPLRILVHSEVVGAIIGRSGSTIRNITQQTKARIDVLREENAEQQEKVITINGSPESCSEACFKIVEVVQNELSAKYGTATGPNSRDITLKILAPNNLIGRLVGKNGSSIKKMMKQTSTRINIATNSLTESTGEHTIVVVGKLEQVRQAERLISAKLRAAYASDLSNTLQTLSQPPYLFNNVLLPYMPNPYARNSILASMVNGPQAGNSANSMSRSIPPSVSSHHVQMSNSMYTAPSYLPLYSNAGAIPGTGAAGLMGFNPVAPGFEQERETVYIYIPSTMVGAIIGKSGSAIKEMISTSGASINVATAPYPSEKTSQHNDRTEEEAANDRSHLANDESTVEKSVVASGDGDSSQEAAPTISPKVSRYQNASNDPQTTRKVTILGYPASQYSAQYMIYRKIAVESGKDKISLMVELTIPSQFVGKLIGKKGATIKSLQMQTRTLIRLPEDKTNNSQSSQQAGCTDGGETCVQITGLFEGSQAAQRQIKSMIRESLYSSSPRQIKTQHYRNNTESDASARNNNQSDGDNHPQSDNGKVSPSSHDRSTTRTTATTSNEKAVSSDRNSVQQGEQNMSQRESLSLSCNNDCHSTKHEDQKSQSNSQILSSSTGSVESERTRVEQELISNNNTMINNLNSATQQQHLQMQSSSKSGKDKRFCTDGVRQSDGESIEHHLENGDSHNKATL